MLPDVLFKIAYKNQYNVTMLLTIREVKRKHEARIQGIERVISIGIGLSEVKKPAIIVGLKHDNKDVIRSNPPFLDRYPVEIQIIETAKAQ